MENIDEIIKRIADEVYDRIRAEGQTGAAAGKTCSGEEWVLSRMNPTLRFDEMKKACGEVKSSKAKTICVPQWFVGPAVEELKGTGVNVATVVGLPGGTTSSFAKYAEVKQAVVAGAEVIFVPVNMSLCALSEWGAAKNDLADSIVPCKGKALVAAILEVDSLSCDQLATAADMCASCGVDVVMLSAVIGGKVSDAQIQAVKQKGICVGVYGGISQSNIGDYQKSGATYFAASAC